MSKYENTGIYEAIEDILGKKLVLPSIQREFVWKPKQIEILFDSIMQGFPIGTFLFWNVPASSVDKFSFYEFMSDFSEDEYDTKRRHNNELKLSIEKDVVGVLDGQQRLTSLFIGLNGTYKIKKRYKNSYEEKRLYLNLTEKDTAENENKIVYDFEFLSDEDISLEKKNNTKNFWFLCSDIRKMKTLSQVNVYLRENGLRDNEFAESTLTNFFERIHINKLISFYQEKNNETDIDECTSLNRVLDIFVRTNNGGTKLEYSDLLLSIATTYWNDGRKNAREIIHEFVDKINLTCGNKFKFNKDVVLKACLVLADKSSNDVKFDVKNFTRGRIEEIKAEWVNIELAISRAVTLLSVLGYSKDNFIANNAIIPISYFIYKNQIGDEIFDSQVHANNRLAISRWLARAFLRGIFGGQADQIYPKMRDAINKSEKGKFDLDVIIEEFKSLSNKSFIFTEDDIDRILNDTNYGDSKCYSVMTLLYDNVEVGMHIDHIHASSLFSQQHLKTACKAETDIKLFTDKKDSISNLQLLNGGDNQSKSDKVFKQWLDDAFDGQNGQRSSFLQRNLMKDDWSFDFKDFLEFSEKRQAVIKSKLMRVLGVKKTELVEDINQVA